MTQQQVIILIGLHTKYHLRTLTHLETSKNLQIVLCEHTCSKQEQSMRLFLQVEQNQ